MNNKITNFEKDNRNLPPVLFEDEWLIAFSKPCGMLVSPDRWNKERGCLVHLVHQFISPEAFNAHRIDADTSGIVLFARTKAALKAVARLFEKRLVGKRYLAIAHSAPPDDQMTIKTGLSLNASRPGTMLVSREGMKALTKINAVKKWRRHSLIEAMPVTGKTHQIRVHLAHIGCPIIADSIYGNGMGLFLSTIKRDYRFSRQRAETPLIARLALHAAELSFAHPFTNKTVRIECPLPKEFNIAIKYLDRFSRSKQ